MSRFVYQLTIRPAGPYTTPEAPGRDWHDTDVVAGGNGHGSVSYDVPLSLEQIQHYALLPVSQMQALNGCEFIQRYAGQWLAVQVRHRVTLYGDCQGLQVESECNGRVKTEVLSYADFCRRSATWLPVPTPPDFGEPLPPVIPCPSGRNDCPSGCPKCPAEAAAATLLLQEGGQPQ